MDLRWLLTSLALSFPALAQDAAADAPAQDAPPAAPAPEAQTPAPSPTAGVQTATPTPAEESAEASAPTAPPPSAGTPAGEKPSAPVPAPKTAGTAGTAPPKASEPAPAPAPKRVEAAPPPAPQRAARPSGGPATDTPSGFTELTRDTETDEQRVQKIARVAFDRILAGDARFLVRGSAFPFYLDARRIEDQETLFRELLQQLRSRRLDLLSVDAIRVFTPAQMEAEYGPPPARLAHLPWKGPQTWIAVANLSNRAAVAIFQNTRSGWRLIAYTD